MSNHHEVDREHLHSLLDKQASDVQKMLNLNQQLIETADISLIQQINQLEDEVDQLDIEIEESAIHILALHQPVAHDLRDTVSSLKINHELERVADLCRNLTERLHQWREESPEIQFEELSEMAKLTSQMFSLTWHSLQKGDSQIATQVRQDDKLVDRLHERLIKIISTKMSEQPTLITTLMNLFSACRILERIADHISNIAGDIIYTTTGKSVRHLAQQAMVRTG